MTRVHDTFGCLHRWFPPEKGSENMTALQWEKSNVQDKEAGRHYWKSKEQTERQHCMKVVPTCVPGECPKASVTQLFSSDNL